MERAEIRRPAQVLRCGPAQAQRSLWASFSPLVKCAAGPGALQVLLQSEPLWSPVWTARWEEILSLWLAGLGLCFVCLGTSQVCGVMRNSPRGRH